MEQYITVYHGSNHIITKPVYGYGKKHNDFGLGFYCTQSDELAKEWAVSSLQDGFCNKYQLNTEYLKILDLCSDSYGILNWMATLVENRVFSLKTPASRKARQFLIDNYGINTGAYDVIIGYRADDAYFDYAESFLYNSITLEQLSKALRLGDLKEQIVIKSEFAFSQLEYLGSESVSKDIYYPKKQSRNSTANSDYLKILEEDNSEGIFIQDIIRRRI